MPGRRHGAHAASARPAVAVPVLAVAVLAAGVLTAVLTAGGPARAADAITAQASSPPSSVGDLSISLTTADDTLITGFTAHILTASGTDVLDLQEADFTLTSGSGAIGTWTINTPITTSQLLLGTYEVTIDAQDGGGGSVTGENAGQLAFLIQPTVTLTASPANLSYGATSTTLSGTVTGLMPDGSTAPLAGQQVQVTDSSGQVKTTQTDSSGDFSVTEDYASTFTASVQGSSVAPASSPPVTVTAGAPTMLTAAVSTTRAVYGHQITVSGKLSYQPGASMEGLAGVSVVVLAPGYPKLSVPVTGADGNFTSTFTATRSGPVRVYFNNPQYLEGGSYPDVAPAQDTTAAITVSLPTSLTRFAAKLASSGTVSVRGCLGVADTSAHSALKVRGTITVQYAARKSGPWHRLGTVSKTSKDAGASCGVTTAEASFTGAFTARLARAYYRASFTPRSGVKWLPSVSTPVLAWKYQTEIRSLKVSPARLAKRGMLTVSGQLLQDRKHWVPLRRQGVEIRFRKPDTATWYDVVRVKTNSRGRFTATVRATATAVWSAYYPGGSSYLATARPGVRVTVG